MSLCSAAMVAQSRPLQIAQSAITRVEHRLLASRKDLEFWLRKHNGTVSVNIPYVDLFDQFASMASYRYYSASSSAKKQYTSLTSLVYLLVVSKLVKMYLQ